jgi:hypothetical protein
VVLALCSGVDDCGGFFFVALAAGRTIVGLGTEGSFRGGAAFLGRAFFGGRRGTRGSSEGGLRNGRGLAWHRASAVAIAFGVLGIAPPGAFGVNEVLFTAAVAVRGARSKMLVFDGRLFCFVEV